ncbi:ParA family protein [Mucilaginibacter rubeus]|jgi:chromosome partitioning protein|uniref:ParA family protein n=2 Tax=Mucilaginibacter rubeus TaxID=2027860 RepID=A0A364WRE3_9SPHI|nr:MULTISPECIES: ParA family protein [Mucilaginibacter]QEM06211.1 ParA family protein [Mucilaginibacter rubeus]QEM13728.1 ParA family protein [Mucilaginibacter rubeus]QEM18794.1 ParA family protein [Mucilaginibacter gossypii]QTE36211.1 ParA family protein [Mucilaginibacter gossypii]QTE44664.1 ParA family protein [Mucilaginibacter rubeus]
MICLFGNQKGGVGKSTLTVLSANYLSLAKDWPVTIIDMDYQQSISQKFEKAKVLENEEPYDVLPANLESFPPLIPVLTKNKKDAILIDLPGKLDDDGLIPVFTSADLVVCPFAYDEFTFESTVLFTVVLKKVNPNVEVVFVPNRIKANVKFEIMSEVNEQLSKFGKITMAIPDRIDFQRITTFQTPLSLYGIITPVFEEIFADRLWKK